MNCKRIGIFDSGIGGLTVLDKIKQYEFEEIVYYADFKHMPYGSKSVEEIVRTCDSIIRFFIKKNIFYIVIACSTATVIALSYLQENFPDVTFITGVNIAIMQAISASKNKRIGVMATENFINNYQCTQQGITLFQEACPLLALMIEKSLDQAEKQAQQHLYNLLQHDIDTVILGCTHYGWIENALKSMKTDITIVRSDNHVIDMKNKISLHKGVTNNIRYYASGSISFTYTRHDHQIIKFYSAS